MLKLMKLLLLLLSAHGFAYAVAAVAPFAVPSAADTSAANNRTRCYCQPVTAGTIAAASVGNATTITYIFDCYFIKCTFKI